MDRFIGDLVPSPQQGQSALKSNMDRFIVLTPHHQLAYKVSLKSNMDRFIVGKQITKAQRPINLKSNMDRFIDSRREV